MRKAFATLLVAAGLNLADPGFGFAAPPVPYSWTGFYVGGNAGYGWGKSNGDSTLTNSLAGSSGFTISSDVAVHSDVLKPSSFVGGGQVGYNWQVSRDWVLGLEADWQSSSGRAGASNSDPYFASAPVGSITGTASSNYDAGISWFGTVRGRVGYAWDHLLFYGTGGLAYGRTKLTGAMADSGVTAFIGPPPPSFSGTASFGVSKTTVGWVSGAGVEGMLANNWTWKVEYLYIDLGSVRADEQGPFGDVLTLHVHMMDNIVRAGLNYQLH
jgi:outer membrane immunogenic protein